MSACRFKVRDCSGRAVRFNSRLLPPYLKRSLSIDELIPWFYLNWRLPRGLGNAAVMLAFPGHYQFSYRNEQSITSGPKVGDHFI